MCCVSFWVSAVDANEAVSPACGAGARAAEDGLVGHSGSRTGQAVQSEQQPRVLGRSCHCLLLRTRPPPLADGVTLLPLDSASVCLSRFRSLLQVFQAPLSCVRVEVHTLERFSRPLGHFHR